MTGRNERRKREGRTGQRGFVAVLAVVLILPLLALVALVVDAGRGRLVLERMNSAVQVGAMAGAQRFTSPAPTAIEEDAATTAAIAAYRASYGASAFGVALEEDPAIDIATTAEGPTITVTGHTRFEPLFMQIFDDDKYSELGVSASAVARRVEGPPVTYQLLQ